MLGLKQWKFVLLMIFVLFICIFSSIHIHNKYQHIKIVKQFAYSIQIKDYKSAVRFILISEQQLGVTPETIEQAFKFLNLPSLRFISIEDEILRWPMLLIKTHWQK